MSKKIKENFLNVSCVVESVVSLLFLMCENMPCACWSPKRPEESVGSPELEL